MKKLININLFWVSLLFLTPGLMAQQWDLNVNVQTPEPKAGKENPNILWVVLEDTNPWMSCYGDKVVKTPHIDKLASDGARFDRAYMTSPVCSPTRSALITGMYQTSIGAHQHYSSYRVWRGIEMKQWDPTHLGVKTLPEIFKAAGYYTFNEGKTHYNFVFSDEDLYDLQEDPHETSNLVHSIKREHAIELAKHRDILYRWIIETDDKGRFPESDEALKAVLDRWGDEAVNKEYDRVRDK